jgi:drug/metabolite transporter (DMT)-like permease
VADLALLLLTLGWGSTFTLVKGALEIGSTGLFLTSRFATAAAVLGLLALTRRTALGPGFWRHGVLLGLTMLGGYLFQTAGLLHTTPSRSGFITGLSVLFVPLVARFAFGRPVRWTAWTGVALALIGLLLLTRPFEQGVVSDQVRLGDLLTAAGAASFAVQIVLMSEWSAGHPLLRFTALQATVVLVGSLLLLAVEGPRLEVGRWPQFAGVVAFTGVLMTAGALVVMTWAQARTGAVRAALIYTLEPVAAAVFSWVATGERLDALGLAGGALIVLGVVAGEVGGAWQARTEAPGAAVAPP